MNELFLLLLSIVGLFAVGCSIALLALGKMIERYPAGDETRRVRSISSPIETTQLSVGLFWVLFPAGSWFVLQETRFLLILGITTLFAICLFMFTALIFSCAVLSTLRSRWKQQPVLHLAPDNPSLTDTMARAARATDVVVKKRYNNPISDFMLNALLKKD